MLSQEETLHHRIVEETNTYLNRLHSQPLTWIDLAGHITAAQVAEACGEMDLAARHLQTAARLLMESHTP